MVTDCLTPIIAEAGVGSIVTLNGQNVLVDGLRFQKMECEPYLTTQSLQYRIALYDNFTYTPKWNFGKLKLYVTPDTCLLTPNGWRNMDWFVEDYPKRIKTLIRVFRIRCITCGKFYLPKRPVSSACSGECLYAAKEAGMVLFNPLNSKSVPDIMQEDWAELSYVRKIELPAGIQAVRVTKLDASGLYANGMLISLPSLCGLGNIET